MQLPLPKGMPEIQKQKTMAEMKEKTNAGIFQKPPFVSLFALSAAIAWGWAYPLIKLGFLEFGISPDMTGSKVLFAGIRFCLSGLIILMTAKASHKDFNCKTKGSWWYILLFCLVNTTLHYSFFYIGLSHSAGSRAAILNSLSVFSVVIFACMFFKSDRLTFNKLTGCIIGFAGVLSLNLGSEESGRFTWLGDGMIILNALCGATASLMTRGLGKRIDVFIGTGLSLAIGGAFLIIPGLCLGGRLPTVTILGFVYLSLLVGISTIGFTLYNKLLTCNSVGKVAIYNSLIPVIGAVTSCLCLHEPFHWKYLIAGTLSTLGIYLINRQKE